MIIIEKLSLISYIQFCWFSSRIKLNQRDDSIYYIDISAGTFYWLKFFQSYTSTNIKKFEWSHDDLEDENGINIGFQIMYNDLGKVWLENEKLVTNDQSEAFSDYFFRGYLKKTMISDYWPSYGSDKSLKNILLMLRAVSIYAKKLVRKSRTVFFIDKRPGMAVIGNYASEYGIQLVTIQNPFISFKSKTIDFLRQNQFISRVKMIVETKLAGHRKFREDVFHDDGTKTPTIVADQVMQFFSASTYWLSSELLPESVVFVSKSHNIDQNILDDIKKSRMSFIALSPHIAKGLDVPLYVSDNKMVFNYKDELRVSWENKIISQHIKKFSREKSYWENLFSSVKSKIYVSHDKWSVNPIPAAAAIKEIGGISAVWQTSYYEFSSPNASVYADIYFPFSTSVAKCEKQNDSEIKYLISVGYTFDYKFQLLESKAIAIKKKLNSQGARKIISFFDGGSTDDKRWGVGNTNYRKDYQFWLEKLLEEEWLGLVIKAKNPGSLKNRLENVAELLDEAINTGRCYFSEEANHHGKNLYSRPAEAALASDIAIHCCLYAGSAGLEAGLTGTPTLFFDRFGLKYSQFYNVNNVVFNDWDVLWDLVKEHFTKKPIPGLGDWSPIIDDLDPFHDGKAAYRMTTYLNWLLEGFEEGLDRKTIMANTAERYANEWGKDKVVYMS